MESNKTCNIFWFRRDLRLQDNNGLFEALRGDLPVLPIFIFDTYILDQLKNKKDHRVEFIHASLVELDTKLKSLGSRLHVYLGTPVDIFEKLLKKYGVHTIFANSDYEPYARERDSKVESLLHKHGILFQTFKDQVIFERSEVVKENGECYSVYTPYKNKWKEVLKEKPIQHFLSEKKLDHFVPTKQATFLSLEDIGFQKTNIPFPAKIIQKKILTYYKVQRDFPALDATSHLGLHLRFGTVSVRDLAQKAIEIKAETWLNELIWREFFMQIMWHNPRVAKEPFKKKYASIPWRTAPQEFKAWCEGKTGYTLVDAGMRELNETGHMHNRVRMVAASFLVKHLLINWQDGEKYFAEKLFDFDLAANNGNWQWVAGCGCDAAPYFRIFNPETQQEKFDKDFKYIQKWVPEYKSSQYSQKIVEHVYARNRALAAFKVLKS